MASALERSDVTRQKQRLNAAYQTQSGPIHQAEAEALCETTPERVRRNGGHSV